MSSRSADVASRAEILGSSAAIRRVLDQARRIAAAEAPVLIEGETGSGKELIARAVHYGGMRQEGPFVPVNCGALPDHLIEAELFGHERGAFTDAKLARRGLVAEADGGTLFLDEVDSLSPKAQVTLLRFLQDQRYRPIGSSRELRVDVRIVSATNQPLPAIAEQGRFRCDLMYRLRILHLRLPPLRERAGDAEELAEHFIAALCRKYGLARKRFDEATLAWLRAYAWPGNVRELESWVHRELLMSDGPVIRAVPAGHGHGHAATASLEPVACDFQSAKAAAMRQFERDYVLAVMRKTAGNVTRAARMAGKERRAFGKLIKKHGIDRLALVE